MKEVLSEIPVRRIKNSRRIRDNAPYPLEGGKENFSDSTT